ncbi:hypothetical protein [Sinorhizobium fredii]|uniref:hypothetical protein n=1 Tax=Rhizobium fredii TaxID=380 RepID=UPI0030A623BF
MSVKNIERGVTDSRMSTMQAIDQRSKPRGSFSSTRTAKARRSTTQEGLIDFRLKFCFPALRRPHYEPPDRRALHQSNDDDRQRSV